MLYRVKLSWNACGMQLGPSNTLIHIPHPMQRDSEIQTILLWGETSIHSFPEKTHQDFRTSTCTNATFYECQSFVNKQVFTLQLAHCFYLKLLHGLNEYILRKLRFVYVHFWNAWPLITDCIVKNLIQKNVNWIENTSIMHKAWNQVNSYPCAPPDSSSCTPDGIFWVYTCRGLQ